MSSLPANLNHLGPIDLLGATGIQSSITSNGIGMTGNIYYCSPSAGTDAGGTTPGTAFTRLIDAYNACLAGNNDVVVLIGNGSATGSARLSSTFTWAKDATHLVGVCSGGPISQRARIAPTAGIAAFANFFVVSGNGCLFKNISLFHGFNAGVAAEICLAVSGQRNAFVNCDIEGMGDVTGATDVGSRSIVITGGENYFGHCNVGLDTVQRTLANSSVEVKGGAARTIFEGCTFIVSSTDGLQYFLLCALAASMDRFVMFKGCNFIVAVGSTSTAIAAAFHLVANTGGIVVFDATSGLFGVTAIGDATTKAITYVSGGTATNGVKGVVAS